MSKTDETLNTELGREFGRQEAITAIKEVPALESCFNRVDQNIKDEGRAVLARGMREYQQGMDEGTLAANAKTGEQRRERLRVFMGVDTIEDNGTKEILEDFISKWYSDNPSVESKFKQENRDTTLGFIGRLEIQISGEMRRNTEFTVKHDGTETKTTKVAALVADALEK